jgi:formate-dependent nitrite reductase membrane component NrfD
MTSHSGDGRNIDPSIGRLEGEGSQQKSGREDGGDLQAYEVWQGRPGAGEPDRDPAYFDRPVLKEPVWIWAVPAYFYAGGTAGAAAVLGEVAELLGRGELDDLVRRARWVASLGAVTGTALLIYDLGRPERFLNMLRVFRPTSAMSVGSWVLAVSTPAFGGSALLPRTGGLSGTVGNLLGKASGVMGIPLAGYTAVLLSSSAVPVWQASRRSLPFLFVSSAISSAAALLGMMHFSDTEERVVRRFAIAGGVAETIAGTFVERDVSRVERVGKPLEEGLSGSLWKAAKTLGTVSLGFSVLPGDFRLKRWIAGIAGTAGGICTRFAIFHAGKASARDPRAAFHQQRAGMNESEAAEAAMVEGPEER